MKTQLDPKEFAILIALRSNPFLSMNELADKMDVKSWLTAKKYYSQLESRGILKKPLALHDPLVLGLTRIYLLVFVNDIKALEGDRETIKKAIEVLNNMIKSLDKDQEPETTSDDWEAEFESQIKNFKLEIGGK